MDQTRKGTTILLQLFVGVLMVAVDLSIEGPVIPAIDKSRQIHYQNVSWIFPVYLLFYLFTLPLLSKLSDAHCRKSIYIELLAFGGIGSLLILLSHKTTSLLIIPVLQGFGLSSADPLTEGSIGHILQDVKRGRTWELSTTFIIKIHTVQVATQQENKFIVVGEKNKKQKTENPGEIDYPGIKLWRNQYVY